MKYRLASFGLVLTVLALSCAPSTGQAPTGSSDQAPNPNQNRTLVLAHRYEFATLAPKVLQSNGPSSTTRLFNAALSMFDDDGAPRGYLAETLPRLNTDTWRVFPDGRMETLYRLRDNLTWQDGAPLTAADFAFAFRVYKDPSLGVFTAIPQDGIDAVVTPDPRTIIVQWRSPNPGGGSLTFEDLDPLPGHLLEAAFTDYAEGRSSRDAFLGMPFWATEYVGAGPYRLEHWDPGVQLQGSAFAGHVLGRPKIDRMVIRLYTDENQTLAAILAGSTVDYACCNTLRFAQLVTLKREWEAAGKGTAISTLGTAVFLFLQQRPEYVGHEALLDLRVRRALGHAVDREAINEGLFDGLGASTETPVPPNVPFYPEVDRLMTRYPLDLNRAVQLMNDAGFTRDAQGFFSNPQGRRFHIDFAVQNASEIERMQAIVSDSWRRAGFEVRTAVIGTQLYTQQETRHTLPGLGYAFFSGAENTFRSSEIGTAANRWSGNNRSAWTHPEYDRLWEATNATLDLSERGRYIAQMMALVSEYLPGYALYFSQGVRTWASSLQGPTTRDSSSFGRSIRSSTSYWDIHDWTFK